MNVRRPDSKEIEPFLFMIAANPTDMLARLVFADWLEEHGESQAAFIRAQIALATGDLKPPERARLTKLESELYWKHHRYWNGQFYRQWIGTPLEARRSHEAGLRGWRYRKGFPEILDVRAECFVKHADLFLGAAPFRQVILRRPPQPAIDFLTAHESLWSQLETLILPGAWNQYGLASLPAALSRKIRIGIRENALAAS